MKNNDLKVKMIDDDELETVSGGKDPGSTRKQCSKCGNFFNCTNSKEILIYKDHVKRCKGKYNYNPQHEYR